LPVRAQLLQRNAGESGQIRPDHRYNAATDAERDEVQRTSRRRAAPL
jgi:hypothetical protein